MFCIYFEFLPIPTSVQILTLYAQFLSRSFKSVDSIRNYNSAIKLYPQFESFHFKSILKGLSRLNPHRTNQAQPTTPYMLYDMFKHFDIYIYILHIVLGGGGGVLVGHLLLKYHQN